MIKAKTNTFEFEPIDLSYNGSDYDFNTIKKFLKHDDDSMNKLQRHEKAI